MHFRLPYPVFFIMIKKMFFLINDKNAIALTFYEFGFG